MSAWLGSRENALGQLAATSGAALVGYQDAGAGSVATTIAARLQRAASVFDFLTAAEIADVQSGALTLDLDVSVQAALDAHTKVRFPAGDYRLTKISPNAGQVIEGDGIGATRLVRFNDGVDSEGLIDVNSGGAALFVQSIQIRHLEVDGLVATKLFSEHKHLMAFSGVDGLDISFVKFSGFRGDGVYLGSVAGERHNKNVSITHCIFDGDTSENRNGVSVIDCDGLLIESCHFYDLSKSTMPGAIDIEPNLNVYHVAKNIVIRGNVFRDIGGSAGVVAIVLTAATYTTQPENFVIADNVYDTTKCAITVDSDATTYARPLSITFTGNTGKVSKYCDMQGYIEGLVYSGNNLHATDRGYFGFNELDQMISAAVTGNVFAGDDAATRGIRFRSGRNIVIANNAFDGITDYCVFLGGATSTLTNVKVSGNVMDGSATVGVEFNGGTLTDHSFEFNDFSAGIAFQGAIPADARIAYNKGYKTRNAGVTGAIASGTAVAHGMDVTPVAVNITSQNVGPTGIYVTAITATQFTINYTGAGPYTFNWEAAGAVEFN